jgi:Uma2 family endonuclease
MATVAEKPVTVERQRFVDEEGKVLFTYRDLLVMEQVGLLGEDEHIELLEGKIFKIMIQPPHAFSTTHLGRSLTLTFPESLVINQDPLRLSDDLDDTQLPQPDLMLVKYKVYVDHPKPEDVYLLVEVSDSTLKKDREVKLALYARMNILEVWIVNLLERKIEVYTNPQDNLYQKRELYDLTASFAPTAFPNKAAQWLPEDVYTVLDKAGRA